MSKIQLDVVALSVRAMGFKDKSELRRALLQGRISSIELLPKLAVQLENEFSDRP